jgi:lysophospholipase L1-like esterase
MKEKAWKRVLDFKPNIVTIMLGTNDSQERYWHGEKAFEQDAQSMIDTLKSLPTKPRIILMLPTKSYPSRYAVRDSMVSGVIIPCLKGIARKNKLETINLYPVLEGHQELFHDKLHPNEEGAKKLADTITAYILSGKK